MVTNVEVAGIPNDPSTNILVQLNLLALGSFAAVQDSRGPIRVAQGMTVELGVVEQFSEGLRRCFVDLTRSDFCHPVRRVQ